MLTGKALDARAAQQLGIVHEVVPARELGSSTDQLVAEIAESAPAALSSTKRFLQEITTEQLASQTDLGATESAAARATTEAREGLQAFLEKRKPRWEAEPRP